MRRKAEVQSSKTPGPSPSGVLVAEHTTATTLVCGVLGRGGVQLDLAKSLLSYSYLVSLSITARWRPSADLFFYFDDDFGEAGHGRAVN